MLSDLDATLIFSFINGGIRLMFLSMLFGFMSFIFNEVVVNKSYAKIFIQSAYVVAGIIFADIGYVIYLIATRI